LLTACGAVFVLALGSAALGLLLAHAPGRTGSTGTGVIGTLSWVWRDVLGMAIVGATVLIAVFPPLVRRMSREQAAARSAQRSVAVGKAFTAAVLDGMDAGLITLDARTKTLSVNRVARRLHGLDEVGDLDDSARAGLSANLRDPDTGKHLPRPALPLDRALGGESCEMTLLIDLDDGRPARHVLVKARPIRDDSGEVIAGAAVIHDISDQVAREQTLAAHAQHIAALGSATRAVLREEDARLAVCEAALTVSNASFVSLFEPDGRGSLECSASAGLDMRGMRMSLSGRSQIAASFNAARTSFVPDVAAESEMDQQTVARLESMSGAPVRSAAYTPVVVAGRSIAVLITTFAEIVSDPSNLIPTLEVLAAEAGVAIEREDLLRRLHAQAVTDPLTGLGNRRAWLVGLTRETARASRSNEPLGVVMLDLDHFKLYNDAHGHPAGDALLARVATAWQARLRGGDVICRVGGEEFGVLLPGCPPDAIRSLVEDLRGLVPEGLTASAGTTFWADGEDALATVARADGLLYEAKDTGRDRQVYRAGPAPTTETDGTRLRAV
jgi:diguanylate cyclase (GGDEF)-like protein